MKDDRLYVILDEVAKKREAAYLEAIRVLELWGDVGAMRALVVLRKGLLP